MYEEFYGLKEKPFSIQPDPSFLYWGRTHRLAYAMLEYGVINQAGISIVTGEVGCGKTTLIHRLLEQLSDTHSVALLSNIQRDRGDLLSWVLMGFGQPFAGMDHVERFAALQRFFIAEYGKGRRVVLIIDEAQNLSIDMLEEIRMLSNINAGKHQLLQLILIGQPQLKQLLNRPDMLQLAQRVGADFHLSPLNRDEVHAYVDTRLAIAGAKRAIFTAAAIDQIAAESKGVPRVINIIADTALVYGFSAGDAMVDRDSIVSVIADKGNYGVFGIASDDDLQLSEAPDAGPTSFIKTPASSGARLNVAESGGEAIKAAAPGGFGDVGSSGVAPTGGPTTLFPDLEQPATGAASAVTAEPRREPEDGVAAFRAVRPAVGQSPQSGAFPRWERAIAEPAVESGKRDDAAAAGPIGVILYGYSQSSETPGTFGANVTQVILVRSARPGAVFDPPDGVDIVDLGGDDASPGRARNAGYRRMKKLAPNVRFVQFLGPQARLDPKWLEAATAFMARRPEVAAISGVEALAEGERRLFQKLRSIRLRKEPGEAIFTSENFFVRAAAFETAGGFRGDIPGAETADLCVRLRRRGAHIWRVEDTMTLIAPAVKGAGGWFAACARDGKSFALRAALHGAPPERLCALERSRAIFWGAVIPTLMVGSASLFGAVAYVADRGLDYRVAIAAPIGAGMLAYLVKIVASAFKHGPFRPSSWAYGVFSTIGHFAEFIGILQAGGIVKEVSQSRRR
ncbi:MAG: AAA family ATPase [Alphaproteobacteria bacterium]|nr:AAA family ATPase [Alphaproteobacteria bacterium]